MTRYRRAWSMESIIYRSSDTFYRTIHCATCCWKWHSCSQEKQFPNSSWFYLLFFYYLTFEGGVRVKYHLNKTEFHYSKATIVNEIVIHEETWTLLYSKFNWNSWAILKKIVDVYPSFHYILLMENKFGPSFDRS